MTGRVSRCQAPAPADAKPVDAKPVDAKPVDATIPAIAKQAMAKPVDAKLADAKPAGGVLAAGRVAPRSVGAGDATPLSLIDLGTNASKPVLIPAVPVQSKPTMAFHDPFHPWGFVPRNDLVQAPRVDEFGFPVAAALSPNKAPARGTSWNPFDD